MLKISGFGLCVLLSMNTYAASNEKAKEADKLLHTTAVLPAIKLSIPQVNPACIDKAWKKHSAELNQAYQQEFSLAELRILNAFFQTPVGKRYILENANQIRLSHALPVSHPANFSESDKQHVQAFFSTPEGKKFSTGDSEKRMREVGLQVGLAIAADCFNK